MNETESLTVALLARSPEIGRVKQRLARTIGDAEAFNCYKVLLQTALEATRDFTTTIWYEGNVEVWNRIAPDQSLRKQPTGDLGTRMFTALKEGAKLVIGTDIPCMNGAYIKQAVNQLSNHEVVLGPSEDGGYCLIGMNNPCENLFRDVLWGSDCVLEQTLSRAQERGLKVALLPKLWDVDTVNDYHRWKREMLQDQSSRTQET